LQSDANLKPQFNKPRKEVHIMWKFDCLEGVVMEAQRFINPHNRHGRPPEHPERRELWMQIASDQECKFIIHSRWLPVRKGHRVAVLVYESVVVGLCNLSTKEIINYTRTDPVGVWKVRDIMMGIAIVVGAGLYGAGWIHSMAVGALTWWLLLLGRVAQRGRFQRRVDGWLGDLLEYAHGEREGQQCQAGESFVDHCRYKYH
jgi:hypothetical protein